MKRSQIKALLLLAVALTGCGAKESGQLSTSGTVTATEVSVAAEVAGKITEVLVTEGKKVAKGDPVAKVDATVLEIQVRQAQAALAGAEARLAEATRGPRPAQLRQAEEMASQAAAAFGGARKNYDTVKALYDQGAATKAALDAATTSLDTTRAQAGAARAQADLVGQGASSEQVKQMEAAVAQAKAVGDLAQLSLERAILRAPVSGTVVRRLAEPGAMVTPGASVAMLANLDDIWLRVYVPENQLNLVKLGQAVAVYVDAYPSRSFAAEVVQIADKAEFTPRNVSTKQERATTVYAVKLQLREGLSGEVKPGMPADVTFTEAGR